MPGVNYYDGSSFQEVAAVQQADGSTAPVYRWDGSQWVKIYPSGAPSSVVAQFDGSTFSTGDGTWQDDVGSADMSITGDPQSVSLSDGSDGVEGDGVDDHGLYPFPLSGSDLQSFAIEFTYQTTATGENAILGVNNGNQQIFIFHNLNSNFSSDDGNLYLKLQDADGNQVSFGPDSADVNDGNIHNIIMNINDAPTNDVEVQIDGTVQSITKTQPNSPDNFGSWSYDMAKFARNNTGTVQDYANLSYGTIRIHDSPISGPTI